MSSTRVTLQRTPGVLLSCLNATTISSPRPCLHILRRFSQTQSWATAEKHQSSAPFQSYPLPSRLPSSPRNEPIPETSIANPVPFVHETRPPAQPKAPSQPDIASEQEAQKPKPVPPKRKFKPRKAALKLTSTAVDQLRQLLDQPEPKLIKVGVRNRGCSGLAYHLEYIDKPASFDEVVEQDGVKVVIDSKALFSIIGSEMDWIEDKLNERFIFRNPNIKEECGCGESFMV
ncbi:hypothetical protein F5B22DRAFT_287802 [Xylaria bambusicola]|uniref:uncharacterized protein n=1 Tax=Xylaria bambusicola TaxID=326684 RepID=UPI0020072B86|nr:uncharacterized protein F5B22DRAFT_287802 [Xylaria bambusicola]KAI0512880.1 hypothetical protein F5B22DRAFT_287802 [Xylaria bambusicola]